MNKELFNKRGKLLGLDYGRARVGVALSNLEKSMCFPKQPLLVKGLSKPKLLNEIKKIIDSENVCGIILGLPLRLDGTDSEMTLEVRKIHEEMKNFFTDINIFLHDERLSSMQADTLMREIGMKRKERASAIDSSSASIILQSFIDQYSISSS